MPVFTNENPWSNCQWIVFDAVGTLIDPNPSVAAAYHGVALRHGSQLTVDEVNRRFKLAFRRSETEVFPDGPTVGSPWLSSHDIEIARWRWIVEEVLSDVDDIEACYRELWDHFARPESWMCFADVGPTLSELQSHGFGVAIASNFDSRLHAVCDGLPELKTIKTRLVSSETGYRKPAPEFYSNLVRQLGCRPGEIVMIGDHAEHDVSGPVAAGMNAFLLDRNRKDMAHTSLRMLSELLPLANRELSSGFVSR